MNPPSQPPRLWTDEQVAQLSEIAYEAGVMQERGRIANVVVELDECWINQARGRREEFVAARLASMIPDDPDWLERSNERLRRHDENSSAAVAGAPPAYTTWHEVHDTVTASVWERTFFDLCPATQAELADIAPASYAGRLAHLGVAA